MARTAPKSLAGGGSLFTRGEEKEVGAGVSQNPPGHHHLPHVDDHGTLGGERAGPQPVDPEATGSVLVLPPGYRQVVRLVRHRRRVLEPMAIPVGAIASTCLRSRAAACALIAVGLRSRVVADASVRWKYEHMYDWN